MNDLKIESVAGREILDPRGNPPPWKRDLRWPTALWHAGLRTFRRIHGEFEALERDGDKGAAIWARA